MESESAPLIGPELATETDADLLAYMAMAGQEPECARAAWEAFYRRHVGYLRRACLRAYGDLLGGEAGAADLTAEVLRIAYEHAGKFDPAGIACPQRLRLRARAWLGWIARRCVQEMLRSRGRLPTRSLELGSWQQVPAPDRPAGTPSSKSELVARALAALGEREQLVIRVTFQWYQPGKAHQRLPNKVAAELAETLGTTPENLRQIRRRALAKIERYLRGHDAGEAMGAQNDGEEAKA